MQWLLPALVFTAILVVGEPCQVYADEQKLDQIGCFVPGECSGNPLLDLDLPSDSPFACQQFCRKNIICRYFTHYLEQCTIFEACDNLVSKQGAISGEWNCPTCSEIGLCMGTFLDVTKEDDEYACLSMCKSRVGCHWMSYHLTSGNCELFEDCENFQEEEWEFVSSSRECEMPGTTTSTTSTTTIPTTTTSPPPDIPLEEVWRSYDLGESIGMAGILSGDFNRNNHTEFVFSAQRNQAIVIIEYDGKGSYDTQGFLPVNGESVTRIIQIGGNHNNLAVAGDSSTGNLVIYDLTTRSILANVPSRFNDPIVDLIAVDVYGDAEEEILVFRDGSEGIMEVLEFCNNTWSITSELNVGSGTACFGSFTGKGKKELIFTTGRIFEFTGNRTFNEIEGFGFGLGIIVQAFDTNGDQIDEVIGAERWYNIDAYSALDMSKIWSHKAEIDLEAVTVYDIDGDGIQDIVYADHQHGSIHALSATNGSEFWKMRNPGNSGVTRLHFGDFDIDGDLEFALGTGYSTTGEDIFHVCNVAQRTEEWRSMDLNGPYRGYDIANVDAKRGLEITYVSSRSASSYDEGITFIVDFETGATKYNSASNHPYDNTWTGVHALTTGDTDGDGQKEIIIGTDDLYDGRVHVLDGETHTLKYSIELEDGSPIYSVAFMMVNGRAKIIAGGGVEHTGSHGVKIYIIDAASGSLEKTSPVISNGWADLWHLAVDEPRNLIYASINQELWQYNITNNHLIHVPEGDGLTSGIAITESGYLIFAKGSSLFIKAGEYVAIKGVSEAVTGPITQSATNKDWVSLSFESSFSLFSVLDGEFMKHQTQFTPWKVQHYLVDGKNFLMVGEKSAVHLFKY